MEPAAKAAPQAAQVDVKTQDKIETNVTTGTKTTDAEIIGIKTNDGSLVIEGDSAGSGTAIIGGGCCVQLSVEYMPLNPRATVKCGVMVEVVDSEGCTLTWEKLFQEGYHVKESIITTYPGARLRVLVENAIARVRWCETFSC